MSNLHDTSTADGAGERPVDSTTGGAGSVPPPCAAGQGARPGAAAARLDPSQFRPKSSREGIPAGRYVRWNAFYYIMEALNRGLSRDPNRKVSWDKWPAPLGLLYLLAKIRFNRSNALTDPYDYATKDTRRFGAEPEKAKHEITTDGTYVSDRDNPQMGAENTRFGSNIPPRKIRPDVENMTPSARDAGRLRWRLTDPDTGEEIVIPALILNPLSAFWIQKSFHGFGGNTKRDPVGQNPHLLPRGPHDNWPGNVAVVDRTTIDPTRVTYDGRPTPINERVHAWVSGETYGTNDAELEKLRLFKCGHLRLDEKGLLPEDPERPGIDLTGFNNNYSPGLSLLHWLFVMEHNAIADHLAFFHPEWSDEKLFQMARKVNAAQIARIHTVEWTEDLLQHLALQLAMHADWYGLIGPKWKMWIMRMCDRYPLVERMTRWLRGIDFLWGMPGSKWEHHDGPFQVPKHFRMVYRLHEMILSAHDIIDPATGERLDRIQLIDFVHNNTRPIVEKYGYDVLANSFVFASAGALKLHNVARTFTQFKNQQDGTLTDLCERDLFRERTDGTGTYNEFRLSVGEPPVTSFMELTGGDAALAHELEVKYGDVDKVDAGIGILAEPKPEGFALGFCQFYQFVLNAPRRVKSNRYLTEGYTYAEYNEGMDWVEHAGGMLGVMERHLPALRAKIEGQDRAFAPWKDPETFPLRLLTKTHEHTARVFKSDLRTLALGAVTGVAAVCSGAVSIWTALILLLLIAIIPACLTVKRMLAMRYLQLVWKKCYTDKRSTMFGTLERAEQSINNAAHFGRLHALAVTGIATALAFAFASSYPLVAILLVVVALSGLVTRKWASRFAQDAHVLKIALRNRMREGLPVTDARDLPGDTAIEKRYWFLRGNNAAPIATFSSIYHALKESGLPWWKALGTAATSIIGFGRKTRRHLSPELRRRYRWAIYLPNLIDAKGNSGTRIYAEVGNGDGITAGDINMREFELMFRKYAPGRDYLTAYDFERMREGNAHRDADEGRGNWLTRLIGRLAARRRSDQLLMMFADRVVAEDKKLVPAISKAMLLRFYQGSAQADLYREHTEGDTDPSVAASK